MRTVRIGNTIDVLWGIFIGEGINEKPYDLTGRNLTMYLKDGFGKRVRLLDFSINGHIIRWRYEGKDQQKAGQYSLILIENEAQKSMHTIDECNVFKLVSSSCQVTNGCDCDCDDNVQIITLELRSKMTVGYSSADNNGSGNIVVDSALSLTSENPVQNKVIANSLTMVQQAIVNEETRAIEEETRLEKLITNNTSSIKGIETKITKQDTRLERLEELVGEGIGSNSVLEKVNANTKAINTLNGDAETEGSVAKAISDAFAWEELSA